MLFHVLLHLLPFHELYHGSVSYTHLDVYKRQAVDRATLYDTAEAISLVKKAAVAKFDETIEVHIRTCLLYTSRCV